jgi:hypothetical protein
MTEDRLDWKVQRNLEKLDKKLKYTHHIKKHIKNYCIEGFKDYWVPRILALTLATGLCVGLAYGLDKILRTTSPSVYSAYVKSDVGISTEEYCAAANAAKKISIPGLSEEDVKKVALGFIAGGKTDYADELRANGYVGIIPIKPAEIGLTRETLEKDSEQCVLFALNSFKQLYEKEKKYLLLGGRDLGFYLEVSVARFWCREKEEEKRYYHNQTSVAYIDHVLCTKNESENYMELRKKLGRDPGWIDKLTDLEARCVYTTLTQMQDIKLK